MRIATSRLYIRPLRDSDRRDYCRTLADPRVFASLKLPVSPDDHDALSKMFDDRQNECIAEVPSRLAISLQKTGSFIGSIGSYPIDQERVGLSIWLGSRYHGQGIGTEALRGYCLPALETFGKKYIFANIASTNKASLALVRAAGFSLSHFKCDPGFGTVVGRVLLDIDRAKAEMNRKFVSTRLVQ